MRMRSMAGHPSEEMRIAAAHNLATPAASLRALARDDSEVVRAVAARNPSTPLEAFAGLASDSSSIVQAAVGLSGRATPEMLEALASTNLVAFEAVAQHDVPLRPNQVRSLAAMGGDVGAAVASNAATPPDVLSILATDPVWTTRAQVAENRNTPPDVLRTLAFDPYAEVRASVAGNASTPLIVLKDMGTGNIAVIERSPPHPYVAAALATDSCEAFRWWVAEFSDCGEVLAVMAKNQDSEVRSAVAGNPATPVRALAGLATDSYAKHQVAANPATPPRWLSRVLAFEAPKETARNPATPAATLRMLATDPDAEVRAAAAASLKRLSMRRCGSVSSIRNAALSILHAPEYWMRSGGHDPGGCDRWCRDAIFDARMRRSIRQMADPWSVPKTPASRPG